MYHLSGRNNNKLILTFIFNVTSFKFGKVNLYIIMYALTLELNEHTTNSFFFFVLPIYLSDFNL